MRLRDAEMARLHSQTGRIITRLRRGPATNYELARIALKYTGRISELRRRGYKITCRKLEGVFGVTEYDLI